MIFFGHVGLTGLAARTAEKYIDELKIDYRLVFIGSILPDLIDKPIGRILFAETFNSGRIFAHTLLFVLGLYGIGLYDWYRYRKIRWLVLAESCLLHDVLDTIWTIPQTFLWPFLGWRFYEKPEEQWLASIWTKLITDPLVFVPEIIGLIIILYTVWELTVHHKLRFFLKSGKLK
jgi:hypothetical protein